MSQNELAQVNEILRNILNPDNNIRKDAELKLNTLRSNIGALVFYLAKLLNESDEKGVKTLASVLLRKTLTTTDKFPISQAWASLDDNSKSQVKENILKAVINETDKNQKIKYCDTMATVCENVFEAKEQWTDLLAFIDQGLRLQLEPSNVANIETVLFLLSQIFSIINEEIISKLDSFISVFESYFKYEDYNLKTRTSQVIGEILSIVKKKDSKKFKHFIPLILEHTYKCLIANNQENNVFF